MNQVRNILDNHALTLMVSGLLLVFWSLSWVLMLICGAPLISWLKHRKGMKWAPREDTPDSHGKKAGTPSMGGIGIIGAALVAFLGVFAFTLTTSKLTRSGITANFLSEIPQYFVFPALVCLHAILGYVDDHSKATNRGGISSKAKLLGQIILATAFLFAVYKYLVFLMVSNGFDSTAIASVWPLFGSWTLILGSLLIIIGTSNAVNLTDGIDGLAAGLCVQVGAVFAVLSLDIGKFNVFGIYANHFWICLGGACLGFLAFNRYPAKVFMGDTGSLALGAALGAGAILTRTVWLLPFIGFIFFVEMFSVIIQVLYFKYTKKRTGEGQRIFRRAPLHHHFELGGWSEWRVVGTFWAVNLATSILGLVLWKMGVLPRFP